MTNRIVLDADVEQALKDLALLDDKEAELRAAKEYGEAEAKEIHSRALLAAQGTVAEREAIARTSEEHIEHMKNLRTVIQNWTAAKNKRDRLTMLIDVWRTESASIRSRT